VKLEQLSVWTRARGDCAAAQVIDRQRQRLDPGVTMTACP
jgi:hypothetical protein